MKRIFRALAQRWTEEGGYRNLLVLSFPLILSTSAWSIQHFVDRMYLAWYSTETVAAAMPAGILNFTTMSLFIGTASFASTFIAQYTGACRNDRIGPVIWQSVYIALIGGLFHLLLVPAAAPFFIWVGHEPAVRASEITYFRILCYGAAPAIASSGLSSFYSGRGFTWPVMWVNFFQTGVNIALDYAMIFGHWGFPEMGIAGAAIATVLSACASCGVLFVLIARSRYERLYGTRSGWRLDRELFLRILRFGVPSGVQFFIDVVGFSIFILLMGRLGTVPLAATNIAFNINTLAFMPMIGIGIGVSILVGQHLGADRADLAERSTHSGFKMTFLYMAAIAICYVTVPDLFINPFATRTHADGFIEIHRIAVILLRFVAFYSLFDGMSIIYSSALKGAGDTRYIMAAIGVLSFSVLVLPAYIALVVLHAGLYTGWFIATTYVVLLAFLFFLRFRTGRWKTMRVIEPMAIVAPCKETI